MSLQQGWPKRCEFRQHGQIVHEGPEGSGVFIDGIERKDFTMHWDDAGQQIFERA